MEPIRLNKYLVDAGVCSRRAADKLIIEGKITIDGVPAVLGVKVTGTEKIVVDGKPVIVGEKHRVIIAYHKPVGIICTSDPNAQDNIVEAVGYPERIFHIGRLDVASSGLILLTNDGEIVNKILRAEGNHQKEYIVKVDVDVTEEKLVLLRNGVDIGDHHKTLPAKVIKMGPKMFAVTIIEGRNRQIRRMCEAAGLIVVGLKRIRVINIMLDNIPPGKWRHLTPAEEKKLLASL